MLKTIRRTWFCFYQSGISFIPSNDVALSNLVFRVLGDLPRKNVDVMAEAVEEANEEAKEAKKKQKKEKKKKRKAENGEEAQDDRLGIR